MTELPTGTVTFFFSDLEGSTRLLQRLGNTFDQLLIDLFEIQRAAIESAGGVEVRTEGDMIFATFPSAIGGVSAAVATLRAIDDHDWPDDVRVRVRIGLHTGEGRLAGPDYVGIDVHRAARISAAGHGGQVLLSDATRSLADSGLPEGVGLRDLGEHRFKDLEDPIRIFQLTVREQKNEFPEISSLSARPNNLPTLLTSFVGREEELDEVARLVESLRLVTLTGPGGSGKTRLALQVATRLLEDFSEGVFFVDLSPIGSIELVASTVAKALHLAVDPGGSPLLAVKNHLQGRELLLVLDNFEQVIEAAEIVGDLIASAPDLKVLVTSRMPLRLYGEQEIEVPPMGFPAVDDPPEELIRHPAVALFVDRARSVEPGFDPDDHLGDIARIAARVDGLPLAIELAASRIRAMNPASILSRLEDSLSLLAGSERGRPDRQRTLRGAIDWSYDLLTQSERRLFARLSVFPGGSSEDAAERVGEDDEADSLFIDILGSLVEKNLVRKIDVAGDGARFNMLEIVREYAGERLRNDFDFEETQLRLGAFFADLVEGAEVRSPSAQRQWFGRFETEMANLRAAMRWAIENQHAGDGLRIAIGLWHFWRLRGPLSEGRELLDLLLALPMPDTPLRAQALNVVGDLAWWDGDFQASRQSHEAALALYRQAGDLEGEVDGLYYVAMLTMWVGRGDAVDQARAEGRVDHVHTAEQMLNQAIELADELGYAVGAARARRGLGLVLGVARGEPASAIPVFQESLAAFEDIGDPWELTQTWVNLANAHRFSGDGERGIEMYLEAVNLMSAAGNRQALAGVLSLVAATESELGRHDRALTIWSAAQAARRGMGAMNPPVADRLMGDPVSAARAAIDETSVEDALARGEEMDLDRAIAYASDLG